MVAIVKTGHSIRRSFMYNENKVKEGVAQLIHVQNYPMDAAKMTEAHRLNMLLNLASRNEYVKRNSVHISLNFTSEDFPTPGKNLSEEEKEAIEKEQAERLSRIAEDYMHGIGFGNQPYLVYKHRDAGHPHIHIVTVKVDHKGKRIETQNIGRVQSEKARKEIELKYGLVQAEQHKREVFRMQPINTDKASYGETETKAAISSRLNYLLTAFKYTSLAELNAVLNQYNIHADVGAENSRIFKNKGLQYRMINASGKFVGNAVKASLLHNNPGLKFLQKQFLINQNLRQEGKPRLITEIEMAFQKLSRPTLKTLSLLLMKAGIKAVYRHSKEGRLYGITYVDLKNKAVYNGSALGKKYSANAIADRCFPEIPIPAHQVTTGKNKLLNIPPVWHIASKPVHFLSPNPSKASPLSLVEAFLSPVHTTSYLPPELRRKRKKKRRKQSNT